MTRTTTRRQFTQTVFTGAVGLTAASCAAAHETNGSTFKGVTVGAQSYSFRDRPVEEAIAAMKEVGFGLCEMWSGHMEPLRETRGAADGRAKLREYRLTTPLSRYEKIGRAFHEAGIDLYAYNYSFRDDFTDEEIERGFEMAKALGAKVITASGHVSVSKRVDRYAKRYDIPVGMHNHSRIRENEFATPKDFDAARMGASHIAINLDIGHFVAAGFDPIDYIERHHGDIVALHIKDRKRNQGENTAFGEGDTPITEVLQLLRDRNFKIPANIEYEYKGADTVAEVKKCFNYCKQALES